MAIPKKLAFNLTMRLSLPIFAHSSRADVSFGGDGWMGTTYLLERRLLDALILTVPNFATSNPVIDKATVDVLVVCI